MANRLSPEDSRILALESKSVVGHTCKVIIAERTGDGVRYLRDRIVRRLSLAPGCRRRIVETPHDLDAPVWADDPNFDVREHVRRVPVAGHAAMTSLECRRGPGRRRRLRQIADITGS